MALVPVQEAAGVASYSLSWVESEHKTNSFTIRLAVILPRRVGGARHGVTTGRVFAVGRKLKHDKITNSDTADNVIVSFIAIDARRAAFTPRAKALLQRRGFSLLGRAACKMVTLNTNNMSGKGKGGKGKAGGRGGKSTSSSAKAGLQFPVARVGRFLKKGGK